jgi:hypothetical protein
VFFGPGLLRDWQIIKSVYHATEYDGFVFYGMLRNLMYGSVSLCGFLTESEVLPMSDILLLVSSS